MTYAKGTSIEAHDTETAIRKMLRKAGADAIAIYDSADRAMVVFEMVERHITFRLPLPDRNSRAFTHTSAGNQHQRREVLRSEEAADKAWEQACRERWRALLLCIKAKLESVESNIETFEDAFLAHVTMPDGRTVSEHIHENIALAYQGGSMQPLLPPPAKPN